MPLTGATAAYKAFKEKERQMMDTIPVGQDNPDFVPEGLPKAPEPIENKPAPPLTFGGWEQDNVFDALVHVESRGRDDAVSPAGARGRYQVMPGTFSNPGFGIKPGQADTPEENERVGREYLRELYNKYGDLDNALRAYNWGPGNVDRWLREGGDVSKLPRETQNYVPQFYKYFETHGLTPQEQKDAIARELDEGEAALSGPGESLSEFTSNRHGIKEETYDTRVTPWMEVFDDIKPQFDQQEADRLQKSSRLKLLGDAMREVVQGAYATKGGNVNPYDPSSTLQSINKYRDMVAQHGQDVREHDLRKLNAYMQAVAEGRSAEEAQAAAARAAEQQDIINRQADRRLDQAEQAQEDRRVANDRAAAAREAGQDAGSGSTVQLHRGAITEDPEYELTPEQFKNLTARSMEYVIENLDSDEMRNFLGPSSHRTISRDRRNVPRDMQERIARTLWVSFPEFEARFLGGEMPEAEKPALFSGGGGLRSLAGSRGPQAQPAAQSQAGGEYDPQIKQVMELNDIPQEYLDSYLQSSAATGTIENFMEYVDWVDAQLNNNQNEQ